MNKRTSTKSISFSTLLLIFSILLIIPGRQVWAQQEEQTAPEKKSARLSLDYLNINNDGPRLIATVKTKGERSYENVPEVSVDFYFKYKDQDNKLGTVITNEKGEATLILPETLRKTLDTLNQFTYLAAIENSEEFDDEEVEAAVWRSHITLELEEQDSTKVVRFSISEPDSLGELTGVEEVEATFYVQRLFGLLPISEVLETTDEEGYLEVEFPNNIPGDSNGEVVIVAKVDDHERFGYLEIRKSTNWGLAQKINPDELARELWSSRANAPIYLIIVVNLMILGVWGMIGYIISQIFKIRRIGTENYQLEKKPLAE